MSDDSAVQFLAGLPIGMVLGLFIAVLWDWYKHGIHNDR